MVEQFAEKHNNAVKLWCTLITLSCQLASSLHFMAFTKNVSLKWAGDKTLLCHWKPFCKMASSDNCIQMCFKQIRSIICIFLLTTSSLQLCQSGGPSLGERQGHG